MKKLQIRRKKEEDAEAVVWRKPFSSRGPDNFVSLSDGENRVSLEWVGGVRRGKLKYKRQSVNEEMEADWEGALYSHSKTEKQMSNFSLCDRKSAQLKKGFHCWLSCSGSFRLTLSSLAVFLDFPLIIFFIDVRTCINKTPQADMCWQKPSICFSSVTDRLGQKESTFVQPPRGYNLDLLYILCYTSIYWCSVCSALLFPVKWDGSMPMLPAVKMTERGICLR